MLRTKAANIDEYIDGFPENVRKLLQQIRTTVHKAAPGAEEAIKYAIPAFVLKGNLVFFAAFKNHIGFYPAPTANKDFQKDFAGYKTSKGTVQFPLDKPLPLTLITKIVKFRIKENEEIANVRARKKSNEAGVR